MNETESINANQIIGMWLAGSVVIYGVGAEC